AQEVPSKLIGVLLEEVLQVLTGPLDLIEHHPGRVDPLVTLHGLIASHCSSEIPDGLRPEPRPREPLPLGMNPLQEATLVLGFLVHVKLLSPLPGLTIRQSPGLLHPSAVLALRLHGQLSLPLNAGDPEALRCTPEPLVPLLRVSVSKHPKLRRPADRLIARFDRGDQPELLHPREMSTHCRLRKHLDFRDGRCSKGPRGGVALQTPVHL